MADQSLPDRLKPLLKAAVLAPSSHNTQPWILQCFKNRISLLADRTRELPENDPDDRELTISCGAALFNIRVAAAHAGIKSNITLMPEPNGNDLLANIDLDEGPPVSDQVAELYSEIAKRRTYRKRFAEELLQSFTLVELANSVEQEGAQLTTLADKNVRHQVGELIAEGAAIQWASRAWRRELANWMHPRRKGDGLTVPGFAAPIAQAIVRTFDMGSGIGAKDRKLAEESPVLAVLSTQDDDQVAWLSAGQALERLLLSGCKLGLQASYLNQPIQTALLRPKLQQVIGATGFPQILLRIGFQTEELPAAPRRALDTVIES